MFECIKKLLGGKKLNLAGQTVYQINDASTPDLRIRLSLPAQPSPMTIKVQGFRGATSDWGSPDADASGCYVTVAKSLEYTQAQAQKPSNWAAVKVLDVVPRAGKQMNAYYDRRALKFFYEPNPRTKKMVYLCESTDIVAHELGHAVLDAMRPDFWQVSALEIWSFHEAFADINALVATMQFDAALDKALQETGGNLRKPNVLSMLAEEVGAALGLKDGLRNALNNFKYVVPETLPTNAPYDKLCAECHSFGRVFLGAWYELMVSMYEQHKQQGMESKKALIKARDVAYGLMVQAIPQSPRVPKYHEGIAKLMVSLAPKEYHDIVRNTFVARQLIAPQVKALSSVHWNDFKVLQEDTKQGRAFVASANNSKFVTVPGKRSMTLGTRLPGDFTALTAGGYNLANVEVEVASDKYYEFDPSGNLVDQYEPHEDEIAEAAKTALSSIVSIGPYEDTMWEVKDGKLCRTYIE